MLDCTGGELEAEVLSGFQVSVKLLVLYRQFHSRGISFNFGTVLRFRDFFFNGVVGPRVAVVNDVKPSRDLFESIATLA